MGAAIGFELHAGVKQHFYTAKEPGLNLKQGSLAVLQKKYIPVRILQGSSAFALKAVLGHAAYAIGFTK